MRPVFADLAAEIQRTVGFYSSTNRQVNFRQVIALGSTVKLPGLIKFLQQSLSLPVKRLDNYDSLHLAPEVSMAQFSENIANLTGVYGLALQGIGLGTINSNILPREIARTAIWKKKQPWFAAAAAMFVITSLFSLLQAKSLKNDIASQETKNYLNKISAVTKKVNQSQTQKSKVQAEMQAAQDTIADYARPYRDRTIIPHILRAVRQCTPNENNVDDPDQLALYEAYRDGEREAVMAIPRPQRQQVFLTRIDIVYLDDLNKSFRNVGLSTTGASSARRRPTAGHSRTGRLGTGADTATEKMSGFAVLIEGYTPHQGYPPQQDSLAFLQPPDVGLDRDRWGFFNRLRYLGKTNQQILSEQKQRDAAALSTTDSLGPDDASTTTDAPLGEKEKIAQQLPFETFVDPSAENIKDYFDASQGNWIEGGATSGAAQPEGLGVIKKQEQADRESVNLRRTSGARRPADSAASAKRSTIEAVLIDPFTHEPISVTYARNLQGEIKTDPLGEGIRENHDYWFRVLLKIRLKEAE